MRFLRNHSQSTRVRAKFTSCSLPLVIALTVFPHSHVIADEPLSSDDAHAATHSNVLNSPSNVDPLDDVVSPGDEDSLGAVDVLGELNVPLVLTPARLKQPRSEVPATVTVIDSRMITELGIRDLHDVFRLVPGMTVGFVASNRPVVSYHGTNADEQRRLQVLVDGRSVYNPNLASVDWLNIPVNLEDIDRIEVTRGPNAAAYGANAFLATVNIITKHPYDTRGARLKFQRGSNGYQRFYGGFGSGAEGFDYRVSMGGKRSDGFDHRRAQEDGSPGEPFHDSYDIKTFNFSSNWQLNARDAINLQLGQSSGITENHPDDLQDSPPDSDDRDQFLSLKWRHELSERHAFSVQTYVQTRRRLVDWRSCVHPIAFSSQLYSLFGRNPYYAEQLLSNSDVPAALLSGHSPGLGSGDDDALALAILQEYMTLDSQYQAQYGKAEICGTANENIEEARYDIEFQDTLSFNDALRLVSGFNVRQDSVKSETYFGGASANVLARVFANLEYHATSWAVINVGGMYEDDRDHGNDFSPRAAVNLHLTPRQTLRFVLSKAIRTPDTYEQSVNWRYYARDLEPTYLGQTEAQTFYNTHSPGGLGNEKIVSREIGYYLHVPEVAVEADIKWFHDSLYDLISAPLQIGSFHPENNLNLTQEGIELELLFRPWPRDDLRLTYAYLDQDESYVGSPLPFNSYFSVSRLYQIESRLSAQNSGSLAWIHRYPAGVSSSVTFYLADPIGLYDYQRLDVRLAKRLAIGPSSLELALQLEHYMNGDPIMYQDNVLDDRNQVFLSADVQF